MQLLVSSSDSLLLPTTVADDRAKYKGASPPKCELITLYIQVSKLAVS